MTALSQAEYHAALRSDFYAFLVRCFLELNPGAEFLPSWHIEVMAAKLQAVRDGRVRRLIINIPPRHLKSLAASTAMPAWLLGHDPAKAIINVTYGQELSDKFARDCRAIMMASWYRGLFQTRLSSARSPLQELVTTQGGFRLATSVGGVLTGRGADFIVIDDPLKPSDAMSESRRIAANEWFDGTLYSRLRQGEGRDRHHHAASARGRPGRPCPQAGGVGGRLLPGDRRGRRRARRRDASRPRNIRSPNRRSASPAARIP